MKAQILKLWDRLRTSFWFLPSLMAGGAVALAFATVAIDEALTKDWRPGEGWAYTGSAEGASAVLGIIASSMMTIAGVVFSMTLVALSLASSQFGPRLLRNFMRDPVNQVVLGTFVATFLYCLLVLRTIRRAEESAFVPHLSVSIGVLFALASIGVFIYFIHHVSVSIQGNEIVARVSAELMECIERLRRPCSRREGAALLPEGFEHGSRPVRAAGDGYLQIVDTEALVELAEQEDVLLRVERRPGQYVVMGSTLVRLWPGDRSIDTMRDRVNACFVLGNQRTSAQDLEFPVHQLVEIAVRALSPGINDPFTAIVCVDRLGSALCRLAQHELPPGYRLDSRERPRVWVPVLTFPAVVDGAFDPIREHARSSAAVTLRLLETLAVVAGATRRAEDRAALRRHAAMLVRGAREALPEEEDRRAVEARFEAARQALREHEDRDVS